MNLAVRRRLSDLRTLLLRQIHRQGSGRCRKIGMRSGKASRLQCVLLINAKFRPKTRKKALQYARLMELITRFELVTSSLPNETNYLNI